MQLGTSTDKYPVSYPALSMSFSNICLDRHICILVAGGFGLVPIGRESCDHRHLVTSTREQE
jgi:hypothetical protein